MLCHHFLWLVRVTYKNQNWRPKRVLNCGLYFRVEMCCGTSRNKVYCTADLLPCTQQILRHDRRTFPRMKVVAPYSSCRHTFSHRCCFNTLFQMKVLIIQWKHLKLKTGLWPLIEERPVCVGPRCQQTVCDNRRRRSMAVRSLGPIASSVHKVHKVKIEVPDLECKLIVLVSPSDKGKRIDSSLLVY